MTKEAEIPPIEVHWRSLGFRDGSAYAGWCSANGFNAFKKKSAHEMRYECEYIKEQRQIEHLRKSRALNLRTVLRELKGGEIKKDDYTGRSISHKIIDKTFGYADQEKTDFLTLLIHLERNSKLLNDEKTTNKVFMLFKYHDFKIRDPLEWSPSTKNADRQFNSLARHMLAKYDMPAFMDNVWDTGTSKNIDWFIDIGNGKNLRKCNHLPFPIGKQVAHYFLQAPPQCSPSDAISWGLVHAMGGDNRLVNAFLATDKMTNGIINTGRHEFCKSVLKFFIDNPMFDLNQFGPVVDFIWNKKYEPQRIVIDGEVLVDNISEQPGFSMNGRDPHALMRQVELWHKALGKESKRGDITWDRSKYKWFNFKEGDPNKGKEVIWNITELLSSVELRLEGRKMKHCVSSYDKSCKSGRCSIWSMEKSGFDGGKCLTIEVSSGEIKQVRGKLNRMAQQKELDILEKWAIREGITISKYVTRRGLL